MAERWPDRMLANDATADEFDFGAVVGVAFRWGYGADQHRIGVPMKRELAEKLWQRLGQILHGR